MSKAFVKEVEPLENEIIFSENINVNNTDTNKTAIGTVVIKNKMYRILIGDDKKWYKQAAIGEDQFDPMNNTPAVTIWDSVYKEFTKKEFEGYFKK